MLADVIDDREDGEGVTAERDLDDLQELDHLAQHDNARPGFQENNYFGGVLINLLCLTAPIIGYYSTWRPLSIKIVLIMSKEME